MWTTTAERMKRKMASNNVQPIIKKHIFFRVLFSPNSLTLSTSISTVLRKRHKTVVCVFSILFCLFYYGLCLPLFFSPRIWYIFIFRGNNNPAQYIVQSNAKFKMSKQEKNIILQVERQKAYKSIKDEKNSSFTSAKSSITHIYEMRVERKSTVNTWNTAVLKNEPAWKTKRREPTTTTTTQKKKRKKTWRL